MKQGRVLQLIFVAGVILIVLYMISESLDNAPRVLRSTDASSVGSVKEVEAGTSHASVVPWDYRIVEREVGDLIGGDMIIVPNNELLPNDHHYATGDTVWILEHMSATMRVHADGRNQVTLSEWQPLKSYPARDEAEVDLANLKVWVETEVDLIGVYQTEHEGERRQFAVITLPSGHDIKQPVDLERYEQLKTQERVRVQLEEVHDYENYDLAMAKFRGWAE